MARWCFPAPNRPRLSQASGSLLLCILAITLFILHADSVRGSARGGAQIFGVGKRQPFGTDPTSWAEPPLRPMLTLQLPKHVTSLGHSAVIAVLFLTSEAFFITLKITISLSLRHSCLVTDENKPGGMRNIPLTGRVVRSPNFPFHFLDGWCFVRVVTKTWRIRPPHGRFWLVHLSLLRGCRGDEAWGVEGSTTNPPSGPRAPCLE